MTQSETEALQREIANTLQMLDKFDTALEVFSRRLENLFKEPETTRKKNQKENK